MNNIKVLIVDDQTLMCDGLKTIIDLEDNMEVVGIAKNGQEAIKICKDIIPDIILMDIRMPLMDGVETTKIIKSLYKDIKILILTTFDDDQYIIEAIANGATGYILKDIEGDDLIGAINDTYRGAFMMPSAIAQKIAKRLSGSNPKASIKERNILKDFSEREIQIAKLMIAGLNNRDIATSVYMSEGTVKNYISNIYSKVGTSERVGAISVLKNYLEDVY